MRNPSALFQHTSSDDTTPSRGRLPPATTRAQPRRVFQIVHPFPSSPTAACAPLVVHQVDVTGPSSANRKTILRMALTRSDQGPLGLRAKCAAEVGGVLGGFDQLQRPAHAREVLGDSLLASRRRRQTNASRRAGWIGSLRRPERLGGNSSVHEVRGLAPVATLRLPEGAIGAEQQ